MTADGAGMDVAESTVGAGTAGAGPPPRPSRWLTGRVAVLVLALVAVGSVAGFRVMERDGRPSAGDRYEVAYEGDDGCGYLNVSVDGLWLRGLTDLSRPPVTAGHGTLVIGQVQEDPASGGRLSVSGVLTLADGTDLEMSGGRVSEGIFSLGGCAIRN